LQSHLELTLSYELQQGYRILRELTCDSNKSFVGPFLNPVDSSSPDYVDYHKRIKRPVWLKQSKLLEMLKHLTMNFSSSTCLNLIEE